MISKDQFLELKHLKSLGVPTTTIAKKIGISVPSANKWLRLDEEAFENYLRNNTPYLEQYRAFIISILKICPQTPATNPFNLAEKFFFFVRTCACTSLNAEIVICLSISLLYHTWRYMALFSVRYCLNTNRAGIFPALQSVKEVPVFVRRKRGLQHK